PNVHDGRGIFGETTRGCGRVARSLAALGEHARPQDRAGIAENPRPSKAGASHRTIPRLQLHLRRNHGYGRAISVGLYDSQLGHNLLGERLLIAVKRRSADVDTLVRKNVNGARRVVTRGRQSAAPRIAAANHEQAITFGETILGTA